MKPEASVVIPAYNSQDILPHCLNSLIEQTANPTTYEIIVIDDGSTDHTPEIVKDYINKAPCILRYIRLERSGRSRARNTGVMAAKGRLIIFLDSDMIVRKEFVESHLTAHNHPGLIVNGSVINTEKPADPNQKSKRVNDLSRAFFATGNVSVERDKIIEAGLFDEDFIEYGWEDLELGQRLRRLGLKRIKSLTAWSYHVQAPITSEKVPGILRKEKERGHTAVLFYRKDPSFRVKMTTLISPIFFLWVKILTPFRWPERPGTIRLLNFLEKNRCKFTFNLILAIMQSHAYVDGIKEALVE